MISNYNTMLVRGNAQCSGELQNTDQKTFPSQQGQQSSQAIKLVGEAENIYLFSCPLLHNPDF
jgi:hypothetical protein